MYAYLRDNVVAHLSAVSREIVDGSVCIEVPAGQTPKIGDIWTGTTFITPQPWPTVAAAQAGRLPVVDALARSKRDAITAGISAAEMASWPIKRAEALAYQVSGSPSDAPNLSIESDARGIALAELVGKVLHKAGLLAALEAEIAGICGRHQDAIRKLLTVADVANYDITGGWPV